MTTAEVAALEGADRAAYEHGLTLSRDEAVAYALREIDFEDDHR